MAEQAQPPRVRRTAAVLSVIFLADLGFAGQGLVSLLIACVGLGMLTAGALWAGLRSGGGPLIRSRAARAGMYLLLGIATVSTMRFHSATAQTHAAQVIDACRAYQARHGTLPDRLDSLVPEFLAAVPRAKYTLQWGESRTGRPGRRRIRSRTWRSRLLGEGCITSRKRAGASSTRLGLARLSHGWRDPAGGGVGTRETGFS